MFILSGLTFSQNTSYQSPYLKVFYGPFNFPSVSIYNREIRAWKVWLIAISAIGRALFIRYVITDYKGVTKNRELRRQQQ